MRMDNRHCCLTQRSRCSVAGIRHIGEVFLISLPMRESLWESFFSSSEVHDGAVGDAMVPKHWETDRYVHVQELVICCWERVQECKGLEVVLILAWQYLIWMEEHILWLQIVKSFSAWLDRRAVLRPPRPPVVGCLWLHIATLCRMGTNLFCFQTRQSCKDHEDPMLELTDVSRPLSWGSSLRLPHLAYLRRLPKAEVIMSWLNWS